MAGSPPGRSHLHVAINGLFLVPPMGGLQTYLNELCRELLSRPDAPELTLLLNASGHAVLSRQPWATEARLVRCDRLGRSGMRALSELSAVGCVADGHRADVVHSVAMTGPLMSRAARVVTIPDTIWITHPEATLTHRLWRTVVPLVARRADRVIAISQAAAAELRTNLKVREGQLDVVPLGFGNTEKTDATPAEPLRGMLGLGPGPIVLNVGQKKPHRNLERLVQAMVRVRHVVNDAQLVLPGPGNPAAEMQLRNLARAQGLEGCVVLPGFLDPPELEGLYAAADAFVLPSLIEGFGLPVLEAMARGVPVACSAESAPAEVAGDAALLFDPTSVQEIADATIRLITDRETSTRLAAAGPARAAQFTWGRCAEQTLASYRRAVDPTGARGL